MKKTLFGLLALGAVSSAGADAVGGYIGTDAGLFYQSDLTATSAVRYGLNLNAVNLFRGGSLGLGGEVAYLNDLSGQNLGGLNPYYGFGLGADVSLGGVTSVSVYPHALAGLRYDVAGPFSVFVEGNAGARVAVGNVGTGVRLGVGARIGLNYQLP